MSVEMATVAQRSLVKTSTDFSTALTHSKLHRLNFSLYTLMSQQKQLRTLLLLDFLEPFRYHSGQKRLLWYFTLSKASFPVVAKIDLLPAHCEYLLVIKH